MIIIIVHAAYIQLSHANYNLIVHKIKQAYIYLVNQT